MKFKNKEHRKNWIASNRTHEECEDCMFKYDMPAPCSGHAEGPVSCCERVFLEKQLDAQTR